MGSDLSVEEARAIIDAEKYISADEITWAASPENSAFMVFSSELTDSNGVSIPGLTAELAFRIPVRFNDCKYTYSIFSFRPGGRKRVYQMEVVPLEDVSHSDSNGRLYGPHEHIGTSVSEVRIGNLGCAHHDKWFREFLTRANIGFGGRYFGPFDGGLFK